MTNKQYRKGRRKEYRIRQQLLFEGYDIAQRSAGSHSPVDVFAIDIDNKEILLIQSKPEGYKKDKYDKFIDKIKGKFNVKFEIR